MATSKSFPKLGKIPNEAVFLAIGLVALVLYFRGKSSSPTTTTASSVVNSPNSPTAPVTSMGHIVDQGLPPDQQTPNEPGTAPIIGGQYA